ncbi:MAG TPA: hypothetical protein VGU69_16925 [Rhizomicrobium sp.]|nr:hypothetical protein [Rhizomicrobium sp.]
MKRPALVACVCTLLAGCATPVPMTSPVGGWLGTGIPGHPEARFIRRFYADGSTEIDYCLQHGKTLHVEYGHWAMGPLGALTVVTDELDDAKVSLQDTYETSSYDGETWTVTLTASASAPDDADNDFDLQRTNDAMKLTSC